MTGTSEDLLQAVYGLRKAAEGQFTGNKYYQAVNEIDGLIDQLDWDAGVAPGKGAAYGFASMLAEVRKIARATLFGNQYYMVANKLDVLASYLTPSANETAKPASEMRAAPAPVHEAPAAAPVNEPLSAPASAKPTFADLAAASKARVEEVAASLGIAPAHHAEPQHHETETLAVGELERRSSEPCAMAELAPIVLEPVAAAAIPAETFAAANLAGAAHDLGSPPAQAWNGAGQGTASAAAPEKAAPPPMEYPTPANDRGPIATRQKIESFDELAAASKARVEHVAESLGIAAAHALPPSHLQAPEAPGERRLESPGSEAFKQSLESIEPAAVSAEAAAGPGAAEAAHDLGSPAAESQVPVEETVAIEIAAAGIAVEPPQLTAAQRIQVEELLEPGRKEPKTLFTLWLDILFGRKK